MSRKSYIVCQKAVAAAVGIIVGISIVMGNAIIPLAAVLVGMLALYICRRQVKEVIADERNYRVSEKAARLTINIFGPVIAILSVVLIALGRNSYPSLEQVGFTLGYSASALIVLYDVFYYYFERKS
jgi:uncharacterized membrane protein